jgi:GNAT superfamily N-acetyltransferase
MHLHTIGVSNIAAQCEKFKPGEGLSSMKIRRPEEGELATLYAWLEQDERSFEERDGGTNPASYWSNAGATGALQAVWEEECGVECKRKGIHCCERLKVAVVEEEGTGGASLPVGFVVLKEDGLTIDALGVWSEWRRKGVAGMLVEHCVEKAQKDSPLPLEFYQVDSLISALLFWKGQGFDKVKTNLLTQSEVKCLSYQRPVRKYLKRK